MEPIDFAILSILQGLLEWLPVSSKTMLMVYMLWRGLPPAYAYSYALFLHLPTLIAALFWLRKDVIRVFKSRDLFLWFVAAVGTSLILGIPLYFLTYAWLSEASGVLCMTIMGLLLICTGLLLRLSRRKVRKLPFMARALVAGVAQAFSAIPGLSRSGLTISFLLLSGEEEERSVRFSFLMGVPVIALASIYEYFSLSPALPPVSILLPSFFLCFVLSIASMELLIRLAKKLPLWLFLVCFGALIAVLEGLLFFLNLNY